MGPAEIHGTVRNLWGLLRSVGLGGTCEACCHLWGWEELVGPAVTYGGVTYGARCDLWGRAEIMGPAEIHGAERNLWGLLSFMVGCLGSSMGLGRTCEACCNLWGRAEIMGPAEIRGAGAICGACCHRAVHLLGSGSMGHCIYGMLYLWGSASMGQRIYGAVRP